MGQRMVGRITNEANAVLQRIEDDESGFTKFRLYFQEGQPPVDLLHAGLAEQADHAWWALELVARAFDRESSVITWTREREIEGDE
jgi:hypothetical protein